VVWAQTGAGSISGFVRDTAGRPLADAEVTVNERRARTDSSGAFRIADLLAGSYEVRARRIGHIPEVKSVVVREGESASVVFALRRRPVMLDTIRVTAECARFRFEGFVCRRRAGHGAYFDVDAIDSINPRFPQDILRDLPGFRVVAVRNGLGVEPLTGWRCLVQLANGAPISLQNPLPKWPNEIIGVEAYARFDDVPPEYQHYAWRGKRCSLIVYWTVVRGRKQ